MPKVRQVPSLRISIVLRCQQSLCILFIHILEEQKKEVQVLKLWTFHGVTVWGYFAVKFNGHSTIYLDATGSTSEDIKHALERLPNIGTVTVSPKIEFVNGFMW